MPKKLLLTIFLIISCSSRDKLIDLEINKVSRVPHVSVKESEQCLKKFKVYYSLAKIKEEEDYSFKHLAKFGMDKVCTENFNLTMSVLNEKFNRVGVILEDVDKSSPRYKDIQAINKLYFKGIEKSSQSLYKKNRSKIARVKTKLKFADFKNAMAKLLIEDKASVIVTWGSKEYLQYYERWQQKIDIPTIAIAKKNSEKKNLFYIYPNHQNYAKAFVKTLRTRNISKISILRPDRYKESSLINGIVKELEKEKIQIDKIADYNPANYNSLDMAARDIFNIDQAERADELKAIYEIEKEKAEAAGLKLGERSVFLRAKTDSQAVFIPDNFKIVRHFVKLFQYYDAKNIQLIGNHEWRSKDLVVPREPYLNGALFVDFMGEKKNFPFNDIVKGEEKVEDVQEDVELEDDYIAMGYYAGLAAQIALKKSKKKNDISRKLNNLELQDEFLGTRPIFVEGAFNWPTFIYQVNNSGFNLINSL
jgi:hypothetical protein